MELSNITFDIITLGCRVNIYESQQIINNLILAKAKYKCDSDTARLVIINSCTVTKNADKKTMYLIRKYQKNPVCKYIVVIGCYVKYNELQDMNKIIIVCDNTNKQNLVNLLKEYKNTPIIAKQNNNLKFDNSLILQKQSSRGYLKIQDGCDAMCSYCIIPYVRGRQRSMPNDMVIKNINTLIDNGFFEIVLTGVNISGYKYNNILFADLLEEINNINRNFRIRISSIEPMYLTRKAIDIVLNNNKFVQSLHLCMQSGSNKVLKSMNRKYNISQYLKIIKYIYKKNILFSFSTDVIVGYPCENNSDFLTTLKIIKKCNFVHVHLFPYSPRLHTASYHMKQVFADNEISKRIKIANEQIKKVASESLKRYIGKIFSVLFEKSTDPNYQYGHGQYFPKIYVKTKKNLHLKLLNIKVIDFYNDGLLGKII